MRLRLNFTAYIDLHPLRPLLVVTLCLVFLRDQVLCVDSTLKFFITSEHIAIDKHAVVFLELSNFLERSLLKGELTTTGKILFSATFTLHRLLSFFEGVLLNNHG